MNDETNTPTDPALAKDGDESNEIEMPIQVVGEFVKSGRKILADYDSATGVVSVRPKWLHLADMIQAEVEATEEWRSKNGQGLNPESVTPDETLEELQRQSEALEKQEQEIAEQEPEVTIPGVDLSNVDPNIAALLAAQQAQMNALLNRLDKQNEEAREDAKLSREKGVVAEGRREMKLNLQRIKDDIDHANKTDGCPMPPKKNPRFGDKTPAYVEWLREWRPDVYEERFGVLERDKKIKLIGKDGQTVNLTADISRRKTHLSEKIERDPNLSPDMDWNA